MKKVIIGSIIGIGVLAGLAIKKINDEREIVEISNDEGVKVVRKESFKEAINKRIDKILKWISENTEKVDSITKASATAASIIGILTATFELYSSIRKTVEKNDKKLIEEVDEIRLRLLYLTPDLEVTTF